jgi:hypothetical protein
MALMLPALSISFSSWSARNRLTRSSAMASYQILFWQDIPSQVKAWDDFDEVKVELAARFVARIDQAAQSQGLTQSDAYLAQWTWSEPQEREGNPEEVAHAVKRDLERQFP